MALPSRSLSLALYRSFTGKHPFIFWVSRWVQGLRSLIQHIPALREGPQSPSVGGRIVTDIIWLCSPSMCSTAVVFRFWEPCGECTP